MGVNKKFIYEGYVRYKIQIILMGNGEMEMGENPLSRLSESGRNIIPDAGTNRCAHVRPD